MMKRFFLFWLFSACIPSIGIGLYSFFQPFDNIGDYQKEDFIHYELPFLIIAIAIFLLISSVLHTLLLRIVVWFSRLLSGQFELRVKVIWLVILSLLIYVIAIFIWLGIGLEINANYYLIVLPSFFIGLVFGLYYWTAKSASTFSGGNL